jgi:uncharacterized protein (DUF1778 family)
MAARTTRIEKLDLRLTDQRSFVLNAARWKAFVAALGAPPRPMPRMERLLREPGFFDAGPNR